MDRTEAAIEDDRVVAVRFEAAVGGALASGDAGHDTSACGRFLRRAIFDAHD